MVKMCLCSKVLQGMELTDAMRAAADIGYRAVELFAIKTHLMPDDPESKTKELKALNDDLGIELASICAYVGGFDVKDDAACGQEIEKFRRHLAQADILDARYIRVNPTYVGYERVPTPDEKKRFAEWAGKCADLADRSGRGICLENNLNMIATVRGTSEVLDLIGRTNVVVSYDPGNIIRADGNNYGRNAVRAFGDRIAILQVKQIDMTIEPLDDPACFVFYDEGHVDYSQIYEALADSDVLEYVSVECHKPPEEGMTERDVAAREYRLIREHARAYFDDLH
ncbi:MAG TPA: sugar phosphate isomerase/epimerase [Planctomycetota bacterium]|nr:sugar phosphate isomerase/epimerase [Planctomycetota bacterium]